MARISDIAVSIVQDRAANSGKEQAAKDVWRKKNKEQLQKVNDITNDSVIAITEDPVMYQKYLDLQSNNTKRSARNIAAILVQNPAATLVQSKSEWEKLGRKVQEQDKNAINIIERKYYENKDGYYYRVTQVYDVSQTQGKNIPLKRYLHDNSPQMETALRSLLNQSPVDLKIRSEMMEAAFYNPQDKTIYIAENEQITDSQYFVALTREMAHAYMHKDSPDTYTREDSAQAAEAVSYMVCKRFGVQADKPQFQSMSKTYSYDIALDERRGLLGELQGRAEMMGSRIDRDISPPLREKQAGSKGDMER